MVGRIIIKLANLGGDRDGFEREGKSVGGRQSNKGKSQFLSIWHRALSGYFIPQMSQQAALVKEV